MLKVAEIFVAVAVAFATAAAFFGCKSVDDERVPVMPVSIGFVTVADWNIYGVNGAGQYNIFIRDERKPADFFYTERSATGFGGVLLVCDYIGEPRAYDLACPVECKRDVRVEVDSDDHNLAVCPMCGSKYDVFSNFGAPVSGEAVRRGNGYGLRQYRVGTGRGGEYRVITN